MVFQSELIKTFFQWKKGGIKRLFICRIGRITIKKIIKSEIKSKMSIFSPENEHGFDLRWISSGEEYVHGSGTWKKISYADHENNLGKTVPRI